MDEEKGAEGESASPTSDSSVSDESDPAEAALTKRKEENAEATAAASADASDSVLQHLQLETRTCSSLSPLPRDLKKDEDALIYATSVSANFKSSSWTLSGVPEKFGSFWWCDGHEFHGELAGGLPQGLGMHLFPNGDRLVCSFKKGVPIASGTLKDAQGDYYDVEYCTNTSIRDGAQPVKRVATVPLMLSYYCQYGASCACIRIPSSHCGPLAADGQPRAGKLQGKVRGELVWARPKHADMPLWNAKQVNGNIVVIMSGPTATHAPLALKIKHADAAGARAVILVDAAVNPTLPPPPHTDEKPERLPGACGGDISGVDGVDGGVVDGSGKGEKEKNPFSETRVNSHTLVCSVVNESCGLLSMCEGLYAHICFDNTSFAGEMQSKNGENIENRGVVVIPMQKRGEVLSKEDADTLMANFLRERRKELASESACGERQPGQRGQMFWAQMFSEGLVDAEMKREIAAAAGIGAARVMGQWQGAVSLLKKGVTSLLSPRVWSIYDGPTAPHARVSPSHAHAQAVPTVEDAREARKGTVATTLEEEECAGGAAGEARRYAMEATEATDYGVRPSAATVEDSDENGTFRGNADLNRLLRLREKVGGCWKNVLGARYKQAHARVSWVVSVDQDGFHLVSRDGLVASDIPDIFFAHRLPWQNDVALAVHVEEGSVVVSGSGLWH